MPIQRRVLQIPARHGGTCTIERRRVGTCSELTGCTTNWCIREVLISRGRRVSAPEGLGKIAGGKRSATPGQPPAHAARPGGAPENMLRTYRMHHLVVHPVSSVQV